MRDSFVFYRSFYESFESLSKKDKLTLFEALCNYALNDVEPKLVGVPAAMFKLLKPQVDANNKRYENGCKGGAPYGNQNARKKQPKNNQKTTEKQRNVNENENDNENVNVNAAETDDTDFYGTLRNVELAKGEYEHLRATYERHKELIDKVSTWLPNAKGSHQNDHFALCLKFANNDNWPKKRKIESGGLPEVVDPLPEEEHDAKVAELKATLNGMFTSS